MYVLVYRSSDSYEIWKLEELKNLKEFDKPLSHFKSIIKYCDKLEDLINELLEDDCFSKDFPPSIIIRKPPKDFILKDISYILELYNDWIE